MSQPKNKYSPLKDLFIQQVYKGKCLKIQDNDSDIIHLYLFAYYIL